MVTALVCLHFESSPNRADLKSKGGILCLPACCHLPKPSAVPITGALFSNEPGVPAGTTCMRDGARLLPWGQNCLSIIKRHRRAARASPESARVVTSKMRGISAWPLGGTRGSQYHAFWSIQAQEVARFRGGNLPSPHTLSL